MAAFEERRIGAYTIRIDRLLCVGFGDCIDAAPDVFVFDDEGIVTFCASPPDPGGALLDACRSCPVDALSLVDESGATLAP
jgi:ferredoxin